MENPISLEQLLPEKPEFVLKSTGKNYRLRLITLEDQVWIRNNLGDEIAIREIFDRMKWEELARLIFRLLEDKSDFIARTEETINDDGEKVTVKLTGPLLLLRAVGQMNEALGMLAALNKTMVLSSPAVEAHLKKEFEKEVKKNAVRGRAGVKSST